MLSPLTTAEDTPVAVTLTGADSDGDPLTYLIVNAPAHGTLSGTAPNLTYTPAANYNGAGQLHLQGQRRPGGLGPGGGGHHRHGSERCAGRRTRRAVTTAEDAPVVITLSGTDVDGDALTYTVVGGPAHGVLSGTAPALTYTPNANYNGPDSFTFKVNDGTADSAPAAVSITVTPVNDPPVGEPAGGDHRRGHGHGHHADRLGPDGDPLTYRRGRPRRRTAR